MLPTDFYSYNFYDFANLSQLSRKQQLCRSNFFKKNSVKVFHSVKTKLPSLSGFLSLAAATKSLSYLKVT